jgi:prevent-host-death family protein
MIVKTITQAKAQLSSLIERVQDGEEVIIGRAGKPVAVLKPWRGTGKPRHPGALRGQIVLAPDFDELPPEFAAEFGAPKV